MDQARISSTDAFFPNVPHVLYQHSKLCGSVLPVYRWGSSTASRHWRSFAKGWFFFFLFSTPWKTIFLNPKQSLDGLLSDHVSKQIAKKLQTMLNLSQIAQVVINLEHFTTACNELESVLMNLRWVAPFIFLVKDARESDTRVLFSASQRGGPVKLASGTSFNSTLSIAQSRIDSIINSKLESFFELAEYNWMPARPQSTVEEPSTYVFEMITFLTAYVDSVLIGLKEEFKTVAYRNALTRINRWLMVCPSTMLRCSEMCPKLLTQ